ncbi:hypothetical protein HN592_03905 [Candidatus Woesearchaeota archaeon]|jgi:hypothetical protein|nr:hypothetical protein [Candidatus Woesearchaeota archaeon]MBT4368358.1 hypothetical protein [Candidatus Woesearchaeota archaeon]MBT4712847.1 hypothetical protein [Candidatus Woesearchaeota archaeon]MBT6639759.1 hypothetical protein [Candidatus Woesearchaeota archaeon]MBT7133931.1 hypothetical protein [Candidatus Woesearchaeota archaeon]
MNFKQFKEDSTNLAYCVAANADRLSGGLYDAGLAAVGAHTIVNPFVGVGAKYVAVLSTAASLIAPHFSESDSKAQDLRFRRNFLVGIGAAVLWFDPACGAGLIAAAGIMFEGKRRAIRASNDERD